MNKSLVYIKSTVQIDSIHLQSLTDINSSAIFKYIDFCDILPTMFVNH